MFALEGARSSEHQKYRANLQIRGVWRHVPWKFFFFYNAKCCELGHFFHFCQAFGGPCPPPLEPPMNPYPCIELITLLSYSCYVCVICNSTHLQTQPIVIKLDFPLSVTGLLPNLSCAFTHIHFVSNVILGLSAIFRCPVAMSQHR